jgi:hypothetical protein
VAENVEPTGTPDVSSLTFVEDINAVGYDWKTFDMNTFTYTVATDKAFYVKYPSPNNTVYRLVFTTFAGSSTGNITFNHEDVTGLLGTQTFANNNSFGVYPNPSTDKKINVVYDLTTNTDKNTVCVYSLTGAKVYEKNLGTTAGFFNESIDLGNLNNGIYVLQFESGDYTATRKIVLQ